MKLELSHSNVLTDYSEIQKTVFLATHHNFNLVSFPLGFSRFSESYVESTKISALIDLPNGNSPTEIRLHCILFAARKHIGIIDLVINHTMVANGDWRSFGKDLAACVEICKAHKLDLRAVFDYRLLEPDRVLELAGVLESFGITEIITSTGELMDDLTDNLIISKQISKEIGLDVIISSNNLNQRNFEKIQEYKPFGVRFTSAQSVMSVFGSY